MKTKLNVLLYKDIKKFLISENINYVVVEENGYFFVKEIPIVFNEHFSFLKQYMAYDYDNLLSHHKEIYQNQYLSLEHIEDNKYQKATKVYQLKKHN